MYDNVEWHAQKFCTDIENYQLIVERQNNHGKCEDSHENWKWIVSVHGSVLASGTVNNVDEAQKRALMHLPPTGH